MRGFDLAIRIGTLGDLIDFFRTRLGEPLDCERGLPRAQTRAQAKGKRPRAPSKARV